MSFPSIPCPIRRRLTLAACSLLIQSTVALAEPVLRIGPLDGWTDSWTQVPDQIELPVGTSAQLEFVWGLNAADFNADHRVDLRDYATISRCLSAPGGQRPTSCDPAGYRDSDLNGDAVVDIADAELFVLAAKDKQNFVVISVTWLGALETDRQPALTRAQVDLNTTGERLVRVHARLIDPISQREINRTRELTIVVLDRPFSEIDLNWAFEQASPVEYARGAPAVQLVVNAFNPLGRPLNLLLAGDEVIFEVGVVVDPDYIPPGQVGGSGNSGLGIMVYDVVGNEAASGGYFLNPMRDASSGVSNDGLDIADPGVGGPAFVSNDFFSSSTNSISANYGGGWGFNRATLPGGGQTDVAGQIVAPGITTRFTWTADTNPGIPGEQPLARQGVGVGDFMFPDDDPVLAGVIGGFGFSVVGNDITPGDGTWIMQTGLIDTTGWDLQTYNFTARPTFVALFNGTLDYTQDFGCCFFSADLPAGNVGAAAFSFTLVDDGCPNDPEKIDPGICGCGTPDDDSDSDGTEDCNDGCPNDANKTAAGQCGCGVAEDDSDSDGIPDCLIIAPLIEDPDGCGGCGVVGTALFPFAIAAYGLLLISRRKSRRIARRSGLQSIPISARVANQASPVCRIRNFTD